MAPMPSFLQQNASGPSGDYVKFDDNSINAPIRMVVRDKYSIRESKYQGQARTVQSGPKKGQPIFEMVLPVTVGDKEMLFSDGGKWRLASAVANAVMNSGAEDLQIGGVLEVTYIGKKAGKGANPAQDFKAEYTPNPDGESAYAEHLDQSLNPAPVQAAPAGFGGGAPQQGGFPGAGFPGAR